MGETDKRAATHKHKWSFSSRGGTQCSFTHLGEFDPAKEPVHAHPDSAAQDGIIMWRACCGDGGCAELSDLLTFAFDDMPANLQMVREQVLRGECPHEWTADSAMCRLCHKSEASVPSALED